ncbi:hypothetical protein [Sebaldella sp. S0638]|uniref:hypothetical protein n=1 Tax=Sebaldella sp. S0638 TaxID=2957809 RepID=UPI0020A21AA7|nr:hypothetical protein [Sebaldella sp. S0638]MCP1223463.1 hypothetical protein [Sebaldella sp. S0638]
MFKNKKLLMFLALNSLVGATAAAGSSNEFNKYENMYKRMTKNLDKNTSNNKNYKVLEKVLNQRNKELKDLYLQSDYIVKPEYLEWQIFFSGFYNVKDRKGEKDVNKLPTPSTSGTIDVSISMPNVVINNSDINISGVSVGSPEVNVNKKMASVPEVSYSNNVTVPEFVIPEFPDVTIAQPTALYTPGALSSSFGLKDDTFYRQGLRIQNYNLESGTFTFNTSKASTTVSNTTGSFSNAVGTIDPTGIANASLNQPAVLPTSDSGSIASFGSPIIVSTSSPNIRIGKDVTINLTSSVYMEQYSTLMLQQALSPNRAALNADTDYAYGGSMAYPDSAANVPFSIFRNSGTIHMFGNYAIAGALDTKDNQNGNRTDYLLVNDGTIIGEYTDSSSKNQIGLAFQGLAAPGTKGERYIIGNDGKMEFRAPNSMAFYMSGVVLGKYQTAYNRGSIDMYGSGSYGLRLKNAGLNNYGIDNSNQKILLESPANMHGDKSIGVYYTGRGIKAEDSIFKVTVGMEKNSYGGNISGNDPNYVENSVGMYIFPYRLSTTSRSIFRDYDVKFGDYAKNSVMFLNDGSENGYYMPDKKFTNPALVEVYMDNSIVKSIDVDTGSNNVVFYNAGVIINSSYVDVPILYIKPDINIGTASKSVDGTLALYNIAGIAHLGGNIETYGEYSHGIYNGVAVRTVSGIQKAGSTLDNTIDGESKSLSIITHGANSAVLYNKESQVDFGVSMKKWTQKS